MKKRRKNPIFVELYNCATFCAVMKKSKLYPHKLHRIEEKFYVKRHNIKEKLKTIF